MNDPLHPRVTRRELLKLSPLLLLGGFAVPNGKSGYSMRVTGAGAGGVGATTDS